MADSPSLDAFVTALLEETGHRRNPYFQALAAKEFAREDFLETQIQFYFAVDFFSRPMAALAAKIPTPAMRTQVLRNVWEEHGEGDATKVHGTTFLELLARLGGVTPDAMELRALWPEIRIFNTALAGVCVLDEYLIGVGTLAMIERMFCEISAWTGRGIVENGWLSADRMIHYDLHADLDVRHSQDFLDVLQPAWERSADDRYYIEQGLRLGGTLFDGLYTGLWTSRRRRLMRERAGPHTRAFAMA